MGDLKLPEGKRLPADHELLQPRYACHTCQDQRFLRYEAEPGTQQFGKLRACPDCNRSSARLQSSVGLLDREASLTWSDINQSVPGSNLSAVVGMVSGIVTRGYGIIWLYGAWGTAKSLILKTAIAEMFRLNTGYVHYTESATWINSMREAVSDGTIAQLRAFYHGLNVLALDEVDKINWSDFASAEWWSLLSTRFNMAEWDTQGITLLASNKRPESNWVDPAVLSRLTDKRVCSLIEVKGRDLRPLADQLFPLESTNDEPTS